jgi:hypothetical protein
MKKIDEYNTADKVRLFNRVYESCLSDFNESAKDEEHDKHYFWEGVISDVLSLDEADWKKHNDGEEIGVPKPTKLTVEIELGDDADVEGLTNFLGGAEQISKFKFQK